MLKVVLNTIAVNQCNKSYSSDFGNQLPRGIIDDNMICAGVPQGGKDTCGVRILYFLTLILWQSIEHFIGWFGWSNPSKKLQLHMHVHTNGNNIFWKILCWKELTWRLYKSIKIYFMDWTNRLAKNLNSFQSSYSS